MTTTMIRLFILSTLLILASAPACPQFLMSGVVVSGFTLYPAWLKGIVYLQWNGTSLTENSGLVTKPCGM